MKKGFFLLLTCLVCMMAQAQVDLDAASNKYYFEETLKLAKKGDVDAQVLVGLSYYNGHGVEKDYTQAAVWWRKAADQGRAEGQYLIGICYYNGQGVKQNTEMAIYWWKLAAKQGHEESQKLLAQYGQTDNEQQPVEELSEDEKLYAENIKAAKQGDAESDKEERDLRNRTFLFV